MGKGEQTRERIVNEAIRLASRDGFENLSIGALAAELRMSKSGLFAHFGSKEELQRSVLEESAARFRDSVLKPALTAPRGEPRLRALFERWLAWADDLSQPGGCPLIAAGIEFDDRPGPQREVLVRAYRELVQFLAKAARLAVDEGHFHDKVDTRLFAFEVYGFISAYHHTKRLLRDERAEALARAAFERLIRSCRATEE